MHPLFTRAFNSERSFFIETDSEIRDETEINWINKNVSSSHFCSFNEINKDEIPKKRSDKSAQLPPAFYMDSFIYGPRWNHFYLHSLSQKVDDFQIDPETYVINLVLSGLLGFLWRLTLST